ncbi:MAG: hypothetical protein IKR48_02485 [Kiritimatiellae bacterium]|nr:hypothetical protein [Kiritimatiellia bacterium]
MWMTDGYVKFESTFDAKMGVQDEIDLDVISRQDTKIIRPRVDKSKEEQKERIKKRAEVFTPSWVCKEMIDLPDREIRKSTDWRGYIREPALEITCGEAPFLASRYDAVSGDMIPVPKRIGILDRKLLAISKYCRKNAWFEHALAAVRASYGFEWQGDNLLIARENILASVVEHYWWRWGKIESTDIAGFPHQDFLRAVSEVISWNLWQMDGLRFVVPMSCHDTVETDLLGGENRTPCEGCTKKKWGPAAADTGPYGECCDIHNGIHCRIILDWETREEIRFVDIVREGRREHGH